MTPYSNSNFYVPRGLNFSFDLSSDYFTLVVVDSIEESVTLTLALES